MRAGYRVLLGVALWALSSTQLHAAPALEKAAAQLARRVESAIVDALGAGSTGVLRDVSLETGAPEEETGRAALVAAFTARLRRSSLLAVDDSTRARELMDALGAEVERARFLPPRDQNRAFGAIRQRLTGQGYGFWIVPAIRTDNAFIRLEAEVILTRNYTTPIVLDVRVRRSVVAGEELTFELSLAQTQVDRDEIIISGANPLLTSRPASTEIYATMIALSVEVPRFRFEGAGFGSDESRTEGAENIKFRTRNVEFLVEGIPLEWRRLGLLAEGRYLNRQDDVTQDIGPDEFEAEAEFRTQEVGGGIVFGNLLNGVSISASVLRSEAEDISGATVLAGLPGAMWEDEGEALEIRARRTTTKWDVDLRLRTMQGTREFDGRYYRGLTTADLAGAGIRGEVNWRWGVLGAGFVGAYSQFEFTDAPSVRPGLRLNAKTEQVMLGARVSARWDLN